jgi:predicted small lipoprotein YifL
MKMKSTIRFIVAGAAMATLLTGCGAKDKPVAQQPQIPPAVANAASPPAPEQTKPQAKSATIQTYFGDENGTSLVAKTTTIAYTADSDKYVAALKALQTSTDGKAVPLFDGFTFSKATLEQGKLKLDVKLSDDARLGSPGEELVLDALQKTLFQFPEVNEIYVTVDGKQVESLMGHVDLPYPIKRK